MSSLCQNHDHCIDDALANAQQICQDNHVRLTAQREQVLRLIWQSHKPLGAYTLIEMLSEITGKAVAPPTVYRALEFLLGLGLIHRINSLNAYLGCTDPSAHNKQHSVNYFLICERCHDTAEFIDTNIDQRVQEHAVDNGFIPQQQWLEVTGICQSCRQ